MIKTILILIIFTSITMPLHSQIMQSSETGIYYLVQEPKTRTTRAPVIFLLHGIGSNEEDLFSLAGRFPNHYYVFSLRAPYTVGPNMFAWYQINFSGSKPVYQSEQEKESRDLLIRLIPELKKKYDCEENPSYLVGFSQGGIMSFNIGLTRPELISGIAVMSGRLLEEIKPFVDTFSIRKQLRIFISHGTNDEVISIEHARHGLAFLKSLTIEAVYKEYSTGHTINESMLNDLMYWLGNQ